MGAVYPPRSRLKEVAIKVPARPRGRRTAGSSAAGPALPRLSHPNIVLYTFGDVDGTPLRHGLRQGDHWPRG
jgi:hypothetical protein